MGRRFASSLCPAPAGKPLDECQKVTVLLTLDARLVLVSLAGERTLPLADFFLAYRQTALTFVFLVAQWPLLNRHAREAPSEMKPGNGDKTS